MTQQATQNHRLPAYAMLQCRQWDGHPTSPHYLGTSSLHTCVLHGARYLHLPTLTAYTAYVILLHAQYTQIKLCSACAYMISAPAAYFIAGVCYE